VRAARLVALLVHLQSRHGATAAELAEVLEVSVRTIYRDVSALQAAGIPLWTETGPGGGVRLLDGWRTRLDGLTGDEAQSLFLAGAPTAAAELGLGAVLAAAEAKVLSALPPELRARAGRVRERFHVDAPGWFHRGEPVPALATVADALWRDQRLEVRYRRADGSVTRTLDPLGLVLKAGVWYLVAAHRGQPRTYRVSRILEAEPLAGRSVRPDGFDLAAWWAASAADFDRAIRPLAIRLRLSGRGLRRLPDVLGTTDVPPGGPPDHDGWHEVAVAVESEEVAADQLTALGPDVEVLDPPSLRAALAAAGAAMAARNA
jgi:predicted DNA-binding transcriptional regulator YafY